MRTAVMCLSCALVLAACASGSVDDKESSEATVASAVATTSAAATTSTAPATTTVPPTTSTAPATTTVPPTTTSTIPAEKLAAAAAVGDMAAGEELFDSPVEGIHNANSCTACHSLDVVDGPWAPSLAGVSDRAGARVAGLSAVDYLRQSIADPTAFTVEGEWRASMPLKYGAVLSDDQIND